MAKQTQRGLGKGLSALLGESADIATVRKPVQYITANIPASGKKPVEGSISLIPVGEVVPNPFQPRKTFDEQALNELTESIKVLGLIQPITVRRISDGRYQIISGERRYRASKAAGLETIPAYIRSTDDSGMLEMAIVENVQRSDLDPIETAMSYQRLIDECHLTQEQMADRIGKSRVAVTNFLRLLKLSPKVQYDVKLGNISVGHAKVLLGLDDKELQESLSDAVIKDGLSVRALEQRIRSILSEKTSKSSANADQTLPEGHAKIAEILGRYFGNNVSVKRKSDGKGTVTMHFDNDEQVLKFLGALLEKNF